jgi:hypothetical protein
MDERPAVRLREYSMFVGKQRVNQMELATSNAKTHDGLLSHPLLPSGRGGDEGAIHIKGYEGGERRDYLKW